MLQYKHQQESKQSTAQTKSVMFYKIIAVITAMKFVLRGIGATAPTWVVPEEGFNGHLDLSVINSTCLVTQVYAHSGDTTEVMYSVHSQNPNGGFSMNDSLIAGNYTLKCNPETMLSSSATSYTVVLRAINSGVSADRSITITVTRTQVTNFNAPVFSGTPNQLIVCRDKIDCRDDIIPDGPFVLFEVTVTDADNDSVTIYLPDADPEIFTAENTKIKVKGSLENLPSRYELKVTATDNGTPQKISSVTVTLILGYAPKFTDPSNSSDVIYLCETLVGGDELIRLQAMDSNSAYANLIYSIEDSPSDTQALFEIEGDRLKIKDGVRSGTFDYENPNDVLKYNVSLRVSDGFFITILHTQIVVEDFNDYPPTFVGTPYTKSVPEETTAGSSVFQVTATDADKTSPNNVVTFSLSGSNYFTINNTSGVISVAAGVTLNYGTTPSYSLIVTATDGGEIDNLTATALITLNISTKPTFDNLASPRSISVDENVATGTPVITLMVTDRDNSGELNVSIKTLSVIGAFVLNGAILQTATSIDRETLSSYTISFTATDGTYTVDSALLTVNVEDVNEKPNISVPSSPVKLLESSPAGTLVFNVSTSDPDMSAPNNVITFSLSGSGSSDFSITPSSGVVSVASGVTLNYSRQPLYQLVITAKDGGTPSLRSSSTVTINIQTNIDDCLSAPCQNGATCSNMVNGYTCFCAPGYTGTTCATGSITRNCTSDGVWQLPQYSCVRENVQAVAKKVESLKENASAAVVVAALNDIATATALSQNTPVEQKLTDKEISVLSSSLEKVASVLSPSSGVLDKNITNIFIESVSNLIDDTNKDSWKSLASADSKGAEKVLTAVDTMGEALSKLLQNSTDTSTIIVKKNLALEVKRFKNTDVLFPDEHLNESEHEDTKWIRNSQSQIQLNATALNGDNVLYMTTAVMYRDMSEILSVKRSTSDGTGDFAEGDIQKINGPILALSISPNITRKLNPPVTIKFQHQLQNYSNPKCSFWSFQGLSKGYWSGEGCKVKSTNVNFTICTCDHLTNFAVLMSPFKQADVNSKALRIISIVGIGISMLCLLATFVVHFVLWKYLRNDRTTALMNLCIALLLSYIIFLAGVDKTENGVACAAVAAILQYMYLVVFCIMLVEGVLIAVTVLYVFKFKSRVRLMLGIAWVLPAVIVRISLGVTKAMGYGNEHFCWLSTDNGLIWSFVGPALFIIAFSIICLMFVVRAIHSTKAMQIKKIAEKVKTSLRSLAVLVPLMGVSWVLGIFFINDSFYFIQYIFAILNSLQGFFIFLFHCILNQKVKEGIRLKQRRKSSTTTLKSALRTPSRDYQNSKDQREKSNFESGDKNPSSTYPSSPNNWI